MACRFAIGMFGFLVIGMFAFLVIGMFSFFVIAVLDTAISMYMDSPIKLGNDIRGGGNDSLRYSIPIPLFKVSSWTPQAFSIMLYKSRFML